MKVGLTEQAKQLKAKAPQTVVDQFDKQYDHSMAAFARVDHSLAYQTALLFIKEAENSTSEPISCRAGCGFCCHQSVFVSNPEFELVKAHLLKNDIKIEQKKLEMQRDDEWDGVYHKLKVIDRKCVFLGSNNACTIYEARPLMCRRHNVYSDPQHCASGSTSEMRFDVNARTEGHLSAYFAHYNGKQFHHHLLAEPDLLKNTEALADDQAPK